jgi:RND family efflux transporter MFP subunit
MSSAEHLDPNRAPSLSGHTPAADTAPPPSISKKSLAVFVVIVLILAVVLGASGILTRMHAQKKLVDDTNTMAVPQVLVITPKAGAPAQEIVLPGNMQAYKDAPIYARTNGYLRKWYVDIGGRVKRGQLLAVIDSPEVDQQLQQGQADLATAQANLQIAKTTADRYEELLKTNSVSRQDRDNFVADEQAKQTTVHSAEANVKRLQDLQSFERITAPFDGVITARNTDEGQLINAGNPGATPGSGRELFHMASIDTLRVFINVPQIYSRDAKPSTVAELTLTQYPGRKFQGKLVRNANAIDQATRTLLVEVDVNNRTGELLPGSYAEVHLKLDASSPTVVLPVSALIFRAEGLQVATLQGSDHAHLVPIVMGRDFGTQVEVVSGLAVGQHVVDSPPDSLVDNEQIRVIQPKK